MLLQVFIDISTLSYCVKLEVEFVDTSTFSTEFLDVASGFVDISTFSYLVKLELEFVDTSTFSTEFLDVASGFC